MLLARRLPSPSFLIAAPHATPSLLLLRPRMAGVGMRNVRGLADAAPGSPKGGKGGDAKGDLAQYTPLSL